MISIVRSKYHVRIEEVWLSMRKDNDKNVDIIQYIQTPKPFGKVDDFFRTLVNDLSESEDELMHRFHKKTRYEINRARREGILTSMVLSTQITNRLIEDVTTFYQVFVEEKKLDIYWKPEELITYLMTFRDNGNLAISKASIDEHILVYHVYIHDDSIASLFMSISHYRRDPASSKNMVGMANRLLHFDDMLTFKSMGLMSYDWGGVSDDEDIQNIARFKREFGGMEKESYYITEAITAKGHLALFAMRILQRLRRHK